jgi:tetratricopeptide (TPR) repeat protein
MHLRHAMECNEPGMQPIPTSLGGRHPAIVGRAFMAFSTCMLGYLDRARLDVEEALRLAQELADPFAIGLARNFCAHIYQLRREPQLAQRQTLALAQLADENGFGMLSALAILHEGIAQSGGEDVAAGIRLLESGWAALQATGASVYSKYWVAWLAESYGKVGQHQRAIQMIEHALSQYSSRRDPVWDAELLRIQGELLLAHSAAGSVLQGEPMLRNDAAEELLLRALRTAREQDAKLFELRAALCLSRYWIARGNAAQAHALLVNVYGWFSEGLATADLLEARLLIEELARFVPSLGARGVSAVSMSRRRAEKR